MQISPYEVILLRLRLSSNDFMYFKLLKFKVFSYFSSIRKLFEGKNKVNSYKIVKLVFIDFSK